MDEAVGQINFGVLIKTFPSKGKNYPPNRDPGSIPMCGYDIYVARRGEGWNVTKANPKVTYRVGRDEDVSLVILPGDALGEGNYNDISFLIHAIQRALEENNVVFEPQVVGKAD
ncbi:hypothetical protein SEMRO_2997_G341830.1 [Seminavis robusta]|nr:hypothetical protein SEMRO_2997_G341830.1 [Seminavis robusta]|eukprot:Sro2997_g341830.1 n/a (114) ;mRNA; f:818-1159